MGSLLVLCLLGFVYNTQANESGFVQIEGAEDGHEYAFRAPAPSWFESQASCELAGGYLVEINSAEEDAAMAGYLRAHYDELGLTDTKGRVWIGASDDDNEGTWLWKNSGANLEN